MDEGDDDQFLKQYTLEFLDFFCIYLPYHDTFTLKNSGPKDARFARYGQINLCHASPFMLSNVATKTYAINSF